jgi:hypothetical protein
LLYLCTTSPLNKSKTLIVIKYEQKRKKKKRLKRTGHLNVFSRVPLRLDLDDKICFETAEVLFLKEGAVGDDGREGRGKKD